MPPRKTSELNAANSRMILTINSRVFLLMIYRSVWGYGNEARFSQKVKLKGYGNEARIVWRPVVTAFNP